MPLDISCIWLFFSLYFVAAAFFVFFLFVCLVIVLVQDRSIFPVGEIEPFCTAVSYSAFGSFPLCSVVFIRAPSVTSVHSSSIPVFFFVPPGVSVSVSTFNLVAISLERYSAICNPLKSRVWQTKSHAAKVITATWVASFILMLPYPISSTLKPFTRRDNSTGHMCRLVWPNDVIQQSW